MPRSFDYIFKRIEEIKSEAENDHNNVEFLVKCSYLEIYNEQILDLLDTGSINLSLREDIKKGVYVEGLTEESTQDVSEMLELIKRGT